MGFRAESSGNRYLAFPATSVANNQAATTAMVWAYIRVAPVAASKFFFLSTTGAGQTKMSLTTDAGGALSIACRRVTGDSLVSVASTGGLISTGSWLHVALVCNWAGSAVRGYLNGVQVATTSPAGWGANSESADSAINYVGSLGTFEIMNADFHDYRYYRREVTAAEMRNIFAVKGADRIRSGLFHRLLLNNGIPGAVIGSNTVRDYANGALIGTPTNSPTWCPGLRTRPKAI